MTLNTEHKGDLFVERTANGDFLVKVEDLRSMGFRSPAGAVLMVGSETHVSLKSLQGVRFVFDENDLALHIDAEPQLLTSQTIELQNQRRQPSVILPSDASVFFNYALHSTNVGRTSSEAGFAGELGARSGNFLLLTDGSTVTDLGGQPRFVRLMSSVTHDDREQLRRTVLGDFFTPTRDLSTGVNLGGISVSKLYALNPAYIHYPMQSVVGTVALPSELEVYVDGQRTRSERVKPGEFQVRDILAYGGARDVQLVLRDPFGRVQRVSYSFYFSDQPLRKGLHEYSYNVGVLRRRYGSESGKYGGAAFSVFHRYGFTDALTLGWRAEGTRELFNAGPLATLVLGPGGVASLAAGRSTIAGRNGGAALFSYTYQARRWGVGATVRRDWGQYAALGDTIVIANRKYEASATGSYQFGARGTASLSHAFFTGRSAVASEPTDTQPFAMAAPQDRRATTLSYSAPLVSGRAALTASLSHIKDRSLGSRNEVSVGVTIFLGGGHSMTASHRHDGNTQSQSLQLVRQQPAGEGLGFVLSADRWSDSTGDTLRGKSTVQYNAQAAILRADLGRARDQLGNPWSDYRLSVAGGVGYAGGSVEFGRPITGSFGIVKVEGLAGVGVTVNGQRIGTTGADGKLFVPALTSYGNNEISIATESIPIDYSIESLSKRISPPLRSGSLIEFATSRLRSFTGTLAAELGEGLQPLEYVEFAIVGQAHAQRFQTGRRGEFYLENLTPGVYKLRATVDGRACDFELTIPLSSEPFVALGDHICRIADPAKSGDLSHGGR
ncbi:MAG: fimbria/pilus outer membrane usher protein [Steroidobacteraceae bacterium]|nr:fimbria/pilus outer membrane usher protein [Steroidobacteraceae bacterium]